MCFFTQLTARCYISYFVLYWKLKCQYSYDQPEHEYNMDIL